MFLGVATIDQCCYGRTSSRGNSFSRYDSANRLAYFLFPLEKHVVAAGQFSSAVISHDQIRLTAEFLGVATRNCCYGRTLFQGMYLHTIYSSSPLSFLVLLREKWLLRPKKFFKGGHCTRFSAARRCVFCSRCCEMRSLLRPYIFKRGTFTGSSLAKH